MIKKEVSSEFKRVRGSFVAFSFMREHINIFCFEIQLATATKKDYTK